MFLSLYIRGLCYKISFKWRVWNERRIVQCSHFLDDLLTLRTRAAHLEEGPYVLEILVAIMAMTCQFRFTKKMTERGGLKLYINWHRKEPKLLVPGAGREGEQTERWIYVKINCMSPIFAGRSSSPRLGMSFHSATSKASSLPGMQLGEKNKGPRAGWPSLLQKVRQALRVNWTLLVPPNSVGSMTLTSQLSFARKRKHLICLSNAWELGGFLKGSAEKGLFLCYLEITIACQNTR